MPLVCPWDQVRAHRQSCLSALRGTLPALEGQHALRSSVDRLTTDLTFSAVEGLEWAARRGEARVPVVPLLEDIGRRPRALWLAWHEEWRSPQPRKGVARPRKDALQFKTSSISIYVGLAGTRKRQVLRGEWAGAEIAGSGAVVYQGQGAAHPHWHLAGLADVDASLRDEGGPRDVAPFELLEQTADVVDFEPSASDGAASRPRMADAGVDDAIWASVHLAASARWAEREWTGSNGPSDMHAFTPSGCPEIQRWVVSCVRYLQSELQGQLERLGGI